MKIRHQVMLPDPRLDTSERAALRERLGWLYGLQRPMTEHEVLRALEVVERGLVE